MKERPNVSQRYDNFIGGEWAAPAANEYLPNINPADRRDIIGDFPNSTTPDAVRAVEAAASAQAAWAALSSHARGEFLRKAGDILESRVDQVARDLMREEGKSLPEAKGETMRGVTILRYYAMQTMLPDGDVIPSAGATTFLYSRRVPLGVCSLITPWNFPIAIPIWKAAPALAFGNTVVLKPSELAPLTAYNIAKVFEDAGIPKGVFNVIFGQGARTGEVLATHLSVSAISFTGSVKTGKTIAAQAVGAGKKYQLEMGGKNAAVILADADMEQAVNLTIQGAFKSAGEKCTATSRAIIHADIYDEFSRRLVEKTKSLKVGPGDDTSAYLGPVISEQAQSNILRAIEEGRSAGAQLLCGGPLDDPALSNGFYVSPSVFGDVQPDSRIAREEVFGPVLCLMRAESFDHALELLNGVEYGLSASLFTRDLNAAMQFADRAQAGMVRINGETAGVEPQAPFGGMKASSSWSREQGLAARDFFTQVKTVSIDRAG
jgi:acyl-CoA reductase-like NAD-dependent aldehyde dehydrogenase